MDRERADRWCEKWILGIFLAILIYAPLATGAYRTQDFLVVQWLTLALAVTWLVRLLINPRLEIYWSSICWLILLFVVYACGRYWTADVEFDARQEWLRILVYALVFFGFIQNLRQPHHLRIICFTLIAVAFFVALYALVQYLTASDQVWSYQRPSIYALRGSGTFINPNHMSGYVEMVLPMALVCIVNRRFSILLRIIIGYAALVMFVGILISFSRGGWISCALGLLPLFVWFLGRRIYRVQGLALLLGFLLVGMIFAVKAKVPPNRQTELGAVKQGENIRLLLWKPSWKIFLDHPLWGVGPDHFDLQFRKYRPEHRDMQARPDRVHNDYLNLLVDYGAVGGLIILAVLVCYWLSLSRNWKIIQPSQASNGEEESKEGALVIASSLGFLAILVHSFFDFNMHIPANALLAVLLVAIGVFHFQWKDDRLWRLQIPSSGQRLLWIAALVAISIYLGRESWIKAEANRRIAIADSHLDCSDNQIQALKNAFDQEPRDHQIAYRIGECLRLRSWQSRPGYEKLANEAIEWFDIAMTLNAYDPYSPVKKGMCLDWLNDHDAAETWYLRSLELDPNGYFINALVGWHYYQSEELLKAKLWFERSLRLFPNVKNFIASYYLGRVNESLSETKPDIGDAM